MKRFTYKNFNISRKAYILGTLATLVFIVYPEALAAAGNTPVGFQAQVFDVQPLAVQQLMGISNRRTLRYSDIVREDRYNQELRNFFEKYNSPLVDHIETLRKQPEMKRIIAISFVESNMCRRNYYNNCGGYTLKTGQLKKYPSFDEWIMDTNELLQRRYANRSYKQMIGVYVVPGSPAWLYGTTRIHQELDEIEAKVYTEQYALVEHSNQLASR